MISVLLPTYNAMPWLKEAVESIYAQTCRDWELIIVDDGSTDGTAEYLGTLQGNVKVITLPENGGLIAALNTGLDQCEGDYIARMDADDISLPERLATQLAFLEANPLISGCGSWVASFGKESHIYRTPAGPDRIRQGLYQYTPIAHPTYFMKREVYDKVRYREPYKHCEDLDWLFRATALFKLSNVQQVLLRYRVSESQIGQKHRREQQNWANSIRNRERGEVMKPKVMICTPSMGDVPWPYLTSLIGLNTHGPIAMCKVWGYYGVATAWNHAVDIFLDAGIEWMLQLDSDATLHPETLTRLWSWDEPMISALAFQRRGPIMPVVYADIPDSEGEYHIEHELVETWLRRYPELLEMNKPAMIQPRPDDALINRMAGNHCRLVHREVFEAIEPPWFVPNKRGINEDFTFHRKAKDADFEPKIDLSVVSGHLMGDWAAGPVDFLAWKSITEFTDTKY